MTRPHAELVDRALKRAADRDRAGARQPDDVLAVEVRRLRRQVELRDEALATARAQLAETAAQLAEADARRTTGGRTAGYHAPKAWTNGTHAAPSSATDPAAPPLGRAAARPTRTAATGEEL